MANGTTSPQQFAIDVLDDLHKKYPKITASKNNVETIEIWEGNEQSPSSWAADQNNPLGVRHGPGGSVTPYPTFAEGALGTADTLENGLYGSILSKFETNANPVATGNAIVNSPWSGGTYEAKGLKAWLSGGPLFASAKGFITRGAAPAGASSSPGPTVLQIPDQVTTSAPPATATTASAPGGSLDPLNWPADAAGEVWSEVEPFLARGFFVVLGLVLVGGAVWRATGPKISGAVNKVAEAA